MGSAWCQVSQWPGDVVEDCIAPVRPCDGLRPAQALVVWVPGQPQGAGTPRNQWWNAGVGMEVVWASWKAPGLLKDGSACMLPWEICPLLPITCIITCTRNVLVYLFNTFISCGQPTWLVT